MITKDEIETIEKSLGNVLKHVGPKAIPNLIY
ncbi:Uncharacterised protein [Legionella waltersii]|nr:Uncharacterised protein [Legionella waltersii]